MAHPDDTVRSPAFTEPVTLHDAKSNYVTTAQIRCDAEAGDYPVHLLGEGRDSRTWAKVRVHGTTTPTAACAHPSPYTTEELWPMLSPVQPVRPGERAHFALGVNAALAVGDGITSPALDATYGLRESAPRTREEAQQPTLEQLTHSATADATVRCGTKPGLYPVHFHFNGSDGGQDYRFEVQLTVLPETGKPGSMCGR
ncbi:hypothetical protein [Streptantibioticus cattleyicolor]|uniref:hypothetical protein n=1 Tax=Streptantibioticus cattleyicolor TaxID=29303 RepID=UPI0002D9E3CE|nr:hypothetical protein [Streptantibioticus cattleyicolor]